jgi:hypothetical protein
MNYLQLFETIRQYISDDKLDSQYINGRRSFIWSRADGATYETTEPGVYEQELQSFLDRDPGDFRSPEDNITIIVGGIGTGKSTTIKRSIESVIAKARNCSVTSNGGLCIAKPIVVVIDFKSWEDEQVLAVEEKRSENFWNLVATCARQAISTEISEEQEVKCFWAWLLNQPKLLRRSLIINKFLSVEREKIIQLSSSLISTPLPQILADLIKKRSRLFDSFKSEDFAWYSVALLAYQCLLPKKTCPCLYLVVDNVDGLEPNTQRLALGLAQLLCAVLKARTLIALRPLTWKNVQGELLIDRKDHYSPHWNSVLISRLTECLVTDRLNLIDHAKEAINQLINALRNESNFLHKMFSATVGISVRYALRNLHNLLQSPILKAAYSNKKFVLDLSVSDLSKAYFFGGASSIIPHAFENLYVTGSSRELSPVVLKPRILDFIKRRQNGMTTMKGIFEFSFKFGHRADMVQTALKELAMRERPLIWSEDGYELFSRKSNSRVMLTPIGYSYIKDLFGELFYEEVCLAKPGEKITPGDVLRFHTEFSEAEFREINHVVNKHEAMYYRAIYGDTALCVEHWKKLFNGLKNIEFSYVGEIGFDEKRENWLLEKLGKILGS